LSYDKYDFISQKWNTVNIKPLTERESAILMLVLQGKSGKEIAKDVCVSYSALRNQMSVLYAKLEVKNMREAALFATNRRMIFPQVKSSTIQKIE